MKVDPIFMQELESEIAHGHTVTVASGRAVAPHAGPDRLAIELNHAERQAWKSLARYKFQMFGYWAAIWVHLNRIGEFKRPNPFRVLVQTSQPYREAADAIERRPAEES